MKRLEGSISSDDDVYFKDCEVKIEVSPFGSAHGDPDVIMPTEIENARSKLRPFKGWVTRSLDTLEHFLEEKPLDHSKLKVEIDLLDERSQKYEDALKDLCVLLDDHLLESEQDKAEREVFDKIRQLKAQYYGSLKSNGTSSSLKAPGSATSSSFNHVLPRLKYPEVELAIFNGDLTEWAEWRDTFQAIVVDQDLPDVLKMNYLKKFAGKKVKLVLKGIPTTKANFNDTWKLLDERYGRNSGIAKDDLLTEINELRAARNSSPTEIRRVYDEVTSIVRQLKVLEISDEELNGQPRMRTETLLTEDLVKDWKTEARKAKKDPRSLDSMLEFLKYEIEDMEDAERGKHIKDKDVKTESRSTASFLLTEGRGKEKKSDRDRAPSCTFCEGDHLPLNCKRSMSVDARYELIRASKACFRCGLKYHHVNNCFYKKRCVCGRRHIPLLCKNSQNTNSKPTYPSSPNSTAQKESSTHQCSCSCASSSFQIKEEKASPITPISYMASSSFGKASSHVSAVNNCQSAVMMRTMAIQVLGGCNPPIRALCDTGGSYTMVLRECARDSKAIHKGYRFLTIDYFGGQTAGRFEIVEMTVIGMSGYGKKTIEAVVVDQIGGSFERVPYSVFEEAKEQGFVPLADGVGDQSDVIAMIIGEDIYDEVITGETKRLPSGLKVTPTLFGWIVHGSHGGYDGTKITMVHCFNVKSSCELLEDFWKLEHIGVLNDELKNDDLEIDLKQCKETGRFSVKWPFKRGKREQLATNRYAAEKRLRNLLSKQSPDEYEEYDAGIQKLLDDGDIEKVEEEKTSNIVSYLPHRAVRKKKKIRIVFDAAAKSNGKLSLNQCLETGDNLLPLMFGILLRFRLGEIAIVGDLARAFLQILLDQDDRDVCRFLWVRNGRLEEYRFRKVFFGATSSPFLLQIVIKELITQEIIYKETAEAMKRNIFMDDLAKSFDTEQAAEKMWIEAVEIFKRGCFDLGKFKSNSKTLREKYADDKDVEIESSFQKMLGVLWDPVSDVLYPGYSFPFQADPTTKREFSSVLGKVYDPMGLLSPIVTPLKIFLQDLWRQKITWDEKLSPELADEAKSVVGGLEHSSTINIPRWLHCRIDGTEPNYLAVFCDASTRAYAAVVYLIIGSGSSKHTKLIASKCRLAPPKLLSEDVCTIPRLELLGALIGARLGKTVKEELSCSIQIQDVYLFTDSMITLRWIQGDHRRWEIFVENRVREIQNIGGIWGWTPGTCNPADIPSRGSNATDLGTNSLWWRGPEWLQKDSTEWPKIPSENLESQLIRSTVAAVKQIPLFEPDVVNPTRTSCFNKTLRSLVHVLRWLPRNKIVGEITVEELVTAEKLIFKQVQQCFFSEEIQNLSIGKQVPSSSRLATLKPFLDTDNLLRIGGRLENIDGTFSEKHPIVLTRCAVVDQLIQWFHEKAQHAGRGIVIVDLRKCGIWILNPKKSVSNVLKKCRKCRRFLASPCSETTPPFPETRVQCTRAFQVTGVDLGGPMFLDDGQKIWFALFTCMAVRAVHLELVNSLSEEAIHMAFQRFSARRGLPHKIISDHGTNFVALGKWINNQNLKISWEYVVEKAPWWGGAWERLIGVTKGLLRKTIGKASLNYEELTTAIVCVEKEVNRRPISFLWESSDSQGGVPIPIYPEQFLLPAGGETREFNDESQLSKELEKRQTWGDNVLKVWREDYLLQVLGDSGEIWKEQRNPIVIGEVVLVRSDAKRIQWQLGVVVQLYQGRDGKNRAAAVKIGEKKVLRRPIQALFKMEIQTSETFLEKIKNTKFEIPNEFDNNDETNELDDNNETNIEFAHDTELNDENKLTQENDIDEIPVVTRTGRLIKKPKKLDL